MSKNDFMYQAILEAEKGISKGHGGPFGAVIVKNGAVIARGHNMVIKKQNPTLHGEIVAINNACRRLHSFDWDGCDLYTTGEPCPMCFCAAMWANINNIYYGCTIKDTEGIGFRDNNFDTIMNIDRAKLTNLHKLGREECLVLFDKYNKIKEKKMY